MTLFIADTPSLLARIRRVSCRSILHFDEAQYPDDHVFRRIWDMRCPWTRWLGPTGTPRLIRALCEADFPIWGKEDNTNETEAGTCPSRSSASPSHSRELMDQG